MRVSVNQNVFAKFPYTTELIVVLKGVNNNTKYSREIIQLLNKQQKTLRDNSSLDLLETDPKYFKWIQLYKEILEPTENSKNFKEKTLPSHVALTKRVLEGKDIPNINPLVNYYNYMSIKWGVAFGGEDLATYLGDVTLRYCEGNEKYLGIGEDEVVQIPKGEIAWVDDHSVTCRMWGWRQSDRTKVVTDSKDVIFYIDIIKGEEGLNDNEIEQMRNEFIEGCKKYFGAEVHWYLLDKENNEAEVNYQTRSLEEYGGKELVEKYFENVASSHVEKGTKGIRKRKADSMGLEDKKQILSALTSQIQEVLNKAGLQIEFEMSEATNSKFGDFSSSTAMKYAKELKQAPALIAKQIVEAINKDVSLVRTFSQIDIIANGFINFTLSDIYVFEQLAVALDDRQFGNSEVGGEKTVLIESPGWNPNKAPHAGHLLNLFLGKALTRLFEATGLKSQMVDIDNDKGIPVMQTIWAYQNFAAGKTPQDEGLAPEVFVDKLYKDGKTAYEGDEKVKEEIKKLQQAWEAGEAEIIKVWDKIVNWAREGQRNVIASYGEVFDADQTHESDVYNKGKELIIENEGKGVIEKLPDGAYIARIEQEYGVPDTIVLKSDGTGLYHTQDIALLVTRIEKYKPWRMIYVVAEEQIAHFQRLFSIVDALGLMPIDNIYHFAYGWVVGKDGKKLASRDGGQLYASELLINLIDAAKSIISARGDGKGIDKTKVEAIAKGVAIGAIKYSFLSRDPFKTIKFDMEEALSFNGKSGPYIMYAYTRGKGILEKIGETSTTSLDAGSLKFNEYERTLMIKLLNYPKIVLDAANNYYPGLLADYLYEVAKLFNNFYENVNVSKSTDEEKSYRSQIIDLTTRVIKHGLKILGIECLEEM
ncbi:MAG: hypothetical protein Fur003_4670 [Candidatus Dojkabacteria bacterium]